MSDKISRNCVRIGDNVIKTTRHTPGMAEAGYVGFGNELHKFTFANEVNWLRKLKDFDRVPNLIDYNESDLTITMDYCGENINKNNIPENWIEQVLLILDEFREYKISHNDIKPSDILVKDEKIMMIDFGWSTSYGHSIPINWPTSIGFDFRYNVKDFNDSYSFFKSIGSVIDENN